MITYLINKYGPDIVKVFEPTLEKLVRAAVEEAVEEVSKEVEKIPNQVISGVNELLPAVINQINATVGNVFAPIRQALSRFGL